MTVALQSNLKCNNLVGIIALYLVVYTGMMDTSQTTPPANIMSQSHQQPLEATQSRNIPEPPALHLPMSPTYPRKPANHIPGMVNPLICDDSHGDFGSNNMVRPNSKYTIT